MEGCQFLLQLNELQLHKPRLLQCVPAQRLGRLLKQLLGTMLHYSNLRVLLRHLLSQVLQLNACLCVCCVKNLMLQSLQQQGRARLPLPLLQNT